MANLINDGIAAIERAIAVCMARRLEPLVQHCLICTSCDGYFNDPSLDSVTPCNSGRFLFAVCVSSSHTGELC